MKTILVIDSDPVTANLTEKFLKNYGYEVEVTSEGKDALDRLNRPRFDLVLSDTQLQGLAGFDILKIMKKCFINTPFVFLTADDDEVTRMEAEALGAARLISKRREYINLPHILDQLFFSSREMVA
ncbi:MAG: response regulator [Flavobacteriales bacterium]|nr:response regulator [Flavobacteriales bacterium]